jgi:hypothetical protein
MFGITAPLGEFLHTIANVAVVDDGAVSQEGDEEPAIPFKVS